MGFEVFFFFFFFLIYIFIWLHWVLVAVCGTKFPDQGWNPGPLHWKHGVSTTRSPGKSP